MAPLGVDHNLIKLTASIDPTRSRRPPPQWCEGTDDLDAARMQGDDWLALLGAATGWDTVDTIPEASHARNPTIPVGHLALFVIVHHPVR